VTTTSYYGQPVLKEPTWTPEIPFYLFFGGLAGGSALLAYVAELDGNDVLARRAWGAAMLGGSISPPLLISDLGVPRRFLNMLRMFKVTSPMSVGSWVLVGAGPANAISAITTWTGRFPLVGAVAKPSAAVLGLPLATYTGALLSQTSIPVWHEARRHLPFVFAAGAAMSAGAAAVVATPVEHAGPARRLALIGCLGELVSVQLMEHRLGDQADPYHGKGAEGFTRGARVLTAAGAVAIAGTAGRSRAGAVLGGSLVLAGALAERWSVFKAGFLSAADPKHVVEPQRRRIRERLARGGSTFATANR
jgi:hypothetical protein